jgi:hypothetical protein
MPEDPLAASRGVMTGCLFMALVLATIAAGSGWALWLSAR